MIETPSSKTILDNLVANNIISYPYVAMDQSKGYIFNAIELFENFGVLPISPHFYLPKIELNVEYWKWIDEFFFSFQF